MEAYGQTTDEQLERLVRENCGQFEGLDSIPENAPEFCQNSSILVDSGLIGNGLITVLVGDAGIESNAGTISAHSRVSNLASSWQRKVVESRLGELSEKEETGNTPDSGGGSSADFLYGKWSLFTTARYVETERSETDLENGYDSDLAQVGLGFDYRFSEKLITGSMLGYWSSSADFNNATGHLDTDALSVMLYGIYMPNERAYMDAYLGYTNLDYSSARNISVPGFESMTTGTTDGDQLLAGVAASYDCYYRPWTLVPGVKMSYAGTSIDGFSEDGGGGFALSYDDQNIDSLITSLDVRVLYTKVFPWGSVMPQARFSYIHEFLNGARSVPSSLSQLPGSTITIVTDSPDRNYYVGEVGVSVLIHKEIQVFINYDNLLGHDFLDAWSISAGLRKDF